METTKSYKNNEHIFTIFTYRYVFDQNNDIVDLKQDVLDLRQFPERLFGSYCYEWGKYNKKVMHRQEIEVGKSNVKHLVNSLSLDKQKELEYLLSIIQKAMLVATGTNIIVIKSELKSYIENLIKI
jgi:hypothetical protein